MSSFRASNQMAAFFGVMTFVTLGTAVAYALVHWLGIPTGSFSVWLVSLLMLWWLVVVVTLPWNLHFQARAVIADALRSQEQSIRVEARDLSYVKRWAKLSLIAAIALHLLSAGGFYLLAAYDVTPVGYYGAVAALALVGLRPAIRAYEYVAERIAQIGKEVRFPRDDVLALRSEVEQLQRSVKAHADRLDLEVPESWAAKSEATIRALRADIEASRAALEDLRRANEDDHRQLARGAEQAAARIGEDAQVLGHVRELVRFFKQA